MTAPCASIESANDLRAVARTLVHVKPGQRYWRWSLGGVAFLGTGFLVFTEVVSGVDTAEAMFVVMLIAPILLVGVAALAGVLHLATSTVEFFRNVLRRLAS